MSKVSFPYDSGSGANVREDQWRMMAQFWLQDGIIAGQDNELQVYGDSSGMQVKVKSGKAWIKGNLFYSNAEEIVSLGLPADSVDPRIDLIILRNDFLADNIDIAVLHGTPDPSPVAPALTSNSTMEEIVMGTVTVDAMAITIAAGKVADSRAFTNPGGEGGDVGDLKISMRDTPKSGWMAMTGQTIDARFSPYIKVYNWALSESKIGAGKLFSGTQAALVCQDLRGYALTSSDNARGLVGALAQPGEQTGGVSHTISAADLPVASPWGINPFSLNLGGKNIGYTAGATPRANMEMGNQDQVEATSTDTPTTTANGAGGGAISLVQPSVAVNVFIKL